LIVLYLGLTHFLLLVLITVQRVRTGEVHLWSEMSVFFVLFIFFLFFIISLVVVNFLILFVLIIVHWLLVVVIVRGASLDFVIFHFI